MSVSTDGFMPQENLRQYLEGSQEMPRSASSSIYYNAPIRSRRPRIDVIAAAIVLLASLGIMILNFPVGTVIGMPAFAYLLSAVKGKERWPM